MSSARENLLLRQYVFDRFAARGGRDAHIHADGSVTILIDGETEGRIFAGWANNLRREMRNDLLGQVPPDFSESISTKIPNPTP